MGVQDKGVGPKKGYNRRHAMGGHKKYDPSEQTTRQLEIRYDDSRG